MQENEGKKKQQMKIITFKATNLKKKNLKQKPTKKTKRHTKKKKRNSNNTERPTECLTAKNKKYK